MRRRVLYPFPDILLQDMVYSSAHDGGYRVVEKEAPSVQNAELKAIAETIAQLREQLPDADESTRQRIVDELSTLRALATSILDSWMEVDDAIEEVLAELFEHDSQPNSDGDTFSPDDGDEPVLMSSPGSVPSRTMADPVSHPNGRTDHLLHGPISLTESWFDLSLKAECSLRKGLAYYDLCMFQEAAKALKISVHHQENPGTRIYLALSHLAAGQVDLAALELGLAKRSAKDHVTLQAVLEVEAQVHAAREDWHTAIDVLYELLTYGADNRDTWYNLGVCHLRLNEFAAADRCFTRALAQNPNDVDASLWRSLTLCLMDRAQEARSVLARYEPSEQHRPEFTILRVLALLSAGMVQAGMDASLAYRASYPSHSLGDELVGLCFTTLGRPDLALCHYKRAISLNPAHGHAVAMFGVCSYLAGDIERARQALLWAEARRPPSTLVQIIQGRLDVVQGQYEAALERFNTLAEHSRLHTRRLAILYRGMLYLSTGESKLAHADFRLCVRLGLPHKVIEAAKSQVEVESEALFQG